MADAVMSGAAGKVLGPRPGKAACSFKQGVVEVMLRVINAVVALLPVVSGILMIAFTANSDSNGSSSSDSTSSSSSSSSNSSQPLAYTAGAVSFAGGALVIIWVIVMLVLRFLNIGLLNLGSKYFLAVDVIINFVLTVVLVVGGVVSIVAAVDWKEADDRVFGSAIATIITSLVGAVFLLVLAVYMIMYIVKDWNDKIIKYTIKEAITG